VPHRQQPCSCWRHVGVVNDIGHRAHRTHRGDRPGPMGVSRGRFPEPLGVPASFWHARTIFWLARTSWGVRRRLLVDRRIGRGGARGRQ
jgi:hypothetical protein